MKTQTEFIERNRLLKGRITLIRFDAESKDRTNTYSGINLVTLLNEIVINSSFNSTIIYKMYVDLPIKLDTPKKLTPEFIEATEQYELNLFI